jgi:hypothetical protein
VGIRTVGGVYLLGTMRVACRFSTDGAVTSVHSTRHKIFMDIISAVLRQKTSTNASPHAAGGSNLRDRSQHTSDVEVTKWARDSARGCVCRPFCAYIHKWGESKDLRDQRI